MATLPRSRTETLKLFNGDSLTLNLKAVDETNTAINITGFTIVFRIGTLNDEDIISYAIGTGITITGGPAGEFTVQIAAANTAALIPGQQYYHQTRITDLSAVANVVTVLSGLVTVSNSLFI